jgi:hypothetical protein
MEGIAQGISAPVSVVRDGYEPFETTVTFSGDIVLDVSLRVGFVISGRVTEDGLGLLRDVTVAIVSGTNAGTSAVSGGALGFYRLEHLLPGTFTIRASKFGYDAVERTMTASSDTTVDFTLRSSYGACLRSVDPVLFERVPSAGAELRISVTANPERRWTATPTDSWIRAIAGAAGAGDGTVVLSVAPAEAGRTEARAGTLRIGCAPDEGQTVKVSQLPDCRISLQGAGAAVSFPREGGTGELSVRTGTPGCSWSAFSQDDWMHTVGVRDSHGDGQIRFVVQPNQTGAPRTGTLVVGESEWKVQQQG